MSIIEFTPAYETQWAGLFTFYFLEDGTCNLSEDTIRSRLCPFILGQWEKGIVRIALLFADDAPIGFSIYQIDDPASDWCKRPGWGFIREFFITPGHRMQGYGKALAAYTETQLRSMGAAKIYLTSEDAIGFWIACGYGNTNEICSNDLLVLTKY